LPGRANLHLLHHSIPAIHHRHISLHIKTSQPIQSNPKPHTELSPQSKPKKTHQSDREVQIQETKLKKGYIAKKSRKKRILKVEKKRNVAATHKGRIESKSEKTNVWFPRRETNAGARTNHEPNTNKH